MENRRSLQSVYEGSEEDKSSFRSESCDIDDDDANELQI